MGDLNAAWNSSRASHALTAWAEDSGWFNRIYQIANAHNFPIHTFRSKGEPVSWIDHILSYGEAGNISLKQAKTPSSLVYRTTLPSLPPSSSMEGHAFPNAYAHLLLPAKRDQSTLTSMTKNK